ncbi:MAG: BatA domain-containing protein [Lentisphaerales bacterium]|nr:BatA domain-containing protein [Lentisphaerales bacterium]
MSFLAATFLVGTLAVAAPFYVHMIRRSPSEHFSFSTLRFLEPSPETVSSRSRLQHIFLMLLRMLAIILLCMAFARPYFISQEMSPGSSNIAVLFLVDQSASMNQAQIQQKLKQQVKERIDLLHPEDKAAIYTFDKHLTLKKDFNETILKPAELKATTESLKPGWNKSDISQALIEASEKLLRVMDEKKLPKADIELFTDLQDDGELEKLKQISWPENINLIIHHTSSEQSNCALHFNGLSKDKSKALFKVSNQSEIQVNNLKLSVTAKNKEVYQATFNLPANQETLINVNLAELPDSKNGYTATITPDKHNIDNQVYFVTPENKPKKIYYIGPNAAPGNTLFYLSQLFPEGNPLARLTTKQSRGKPDLIIIDGKISTTTNSLLRSYIQKGATALLLLNDAKQTEQLNTLTNQQFTVSDGTVKDYQMLSSIDYDHWLFQSFIDPLYKDFSSIYFWKYRHLEVAQNNELRFLAKFENRSPAVMSKTLGKGEIIIMSSSWHKEDSQLAVNAKFVPFMLSLLNAASRHDSTQQNFDIADLPHFSKMGLTDSKGLAIKDVKPGIYQLNSAENKTTIAINLSAQESSTKQLNEQVITASGVNTVKSSKLAEHMKERHNNEEMTQELTTAKKSNLWQYFLIGALIFIAIESIVGHFTHKRMTLNES